MKRVLAFVLALLLALPGQAAQVATVPGAAAFARIEPAAVLDQHGTARRFDRIVGEDPVVIGFTFSGCGSFCPISDEALMEVARTAGPGVGVVVVSLDPMLDTPEILAAHARALGAPPNVTFVTGAPAAVAQVLRGLGQDVGRREDHEPLILVRARAGTLFRAVRTLEPEAVFSALAGPG